MSTTIRVQLQQIERLPGVRKLIHEAECDVSTMLENLTASKLLKLAKRANESAPFLSESTSRIYPATLRARLIALCHATKLEGN